MGTMHKDDVYRILLCVPNFLVFFVTNCYGLFAYIVWMLLLMPLRPLFPSVFWAIEVTLFRGLQTFMILWMDKGQYRIIESGDDVSKISDKETVVLCNHQSTADTPLVMMALWGKGQGIHNSTWIMDWMFRFTNFGLVSTLRQDVFIRQGKETRELQGVMLKEHLKNYYLPQQRKWIVLFPEGGFLHKRLETSQRYAEKNGYPVLQHVTLPRTGALKAIIDTIGATENNEILNEPKDNCKYNSEPHRPLNWLIDMTMGYLNKEGAAPDMLGMCLGYRKEQDIHVHYRAYPLSVIPKDGEGLLKWLYDRYEEKDHLLDHLYTHGHFPQESKGRWLPIQPSQQVTYNWKIVVLFQVFYAVSAWFQYYYLVKPLMSLLF